MRRGEAAVVVAIVGVVVDVGVGVGVGFVVEKSMIRSLTLVADSSLGDESA